MRGRSGPPHHHTFTAATACTNPIIIVVFFTTKHPHPSETFKFKKKRIPPKILRSSQVGHQSNNHESRMGRKRSSGKFFSITHQADQIDHLHLLLLRILWSGLAWSAFLTYSPTRPPDDADDSYVDVSPLVRALQIEHSKHYDTHSLALFVVWGSPGCRYHHLLLLLIHSLWLWVSRFPKFIIVIRGREVVGKIVLVANPAEGDAP